MATTKPIFNQFNGGEISPWLEGRIDLPKYQYSARTMKDFIALSEGGAKRRGGTHYVASLKEVDALLFKIVPVPTEAEIYINNQLIDELYVAKGDVVSYSVSQDGFQTESGSLTVIEDTTLDIELLSLKLRNTLTIKTIPEDADVYINGTKTNRLEVLHRSVANYEIFHNDFDTYRGSMQIAEDTMLNIEMTMSFVIDVIQDGAKVIINGEERSSILVEAGDVINWSVEKEGFLPRSGIHEVTGAVTLSINLESIYEINSVIFESSTPGNYLVDLKVPGYYRIRTCGAGGGGGGSAVKHSWLGGNGGQSAAFSGKCWLNQGSYSVIIGRGGAGGAASGRNAPTGWNGTLSQIIHGSEMLLICGAGGWGYGTGYYASQHILDDAGKGGILQIGSLNIQSYTIKKDGEAASTQSPINNGFGSGGPAREAMAGTDGANGYVQFQYLGQV